ncbi:MAG TPA: L-rhamnose isomerase [Lacipirellulaceae bacterium]|nr:L-rhamnose isomerase [Lacipirellulaceae bacterium]
MTNSERQIERAYGLAREQFAELGVDTELVLERLRAVSISLHCWQGDDVGGFEGRQGALDGGLAVTGNYPGKARSADQLRGDLECALRLIPGKHRVNLHAIYAETGGGSVERTDLEPKHFSGWIDWARKQGLKLDFNPTFFSHPLAASGLTLSHSDEAIRRYWVEHGRACRRIGAAMGQALSSACVTNVWIPDGSKEAPIDRRLPRERLRRSLDEIFAEKLDPRHNLDSVESKLFGIGSESYVVGSHEFYLGYAIERGVLLCLDSGHFHPTESVADKISSVLTWVKDLLLHVSRGVRWDSDHVVILSDDLRAMMQEVVRGGFLERTRIALDYFDASINRVAAWVVGTRATLIALLAALLEPVDSLCKLEADVDFTARLAMLEALKNLPVGAVWDYHCAASSVPAGATWLDEVRKYERDVLSRR